MEKMRTATVGTYLGRLRSWKGRGGLKVGKRNGRGQMEEVTLVEEKLGKEGGTQKM